MCAKMSKWKIVSKCNPASTSTTSLLVSITLLCTKVATLVPWSFSKIWLCKKWKSLVLSNSLWPHGLYRPWDSPGQDTGEGSYSLLQEIFINQASIPGLPYCGRILHQLSHKGSPRTLVWVSYPYSSRCSQPRNPTGVSFIAGGSFTNRAIRDVLIM